MAETSIWDVGTVGPRGPRGYTGPTGPNVEFQSNGTYIQWRAVGTITWNNLVHLDSIKGTQGSIGIPGIQGPTGATGLVGATGATGAQGVPGLSSIIRNGIGSPTVEIGNDLDYYIDTANGRFYGPKTGGIWPTEYTSIVGPMGPAGPSGAYEVEIPFSYGDASPTPVYIAVADKLIYRTKINIKTPFNGTPSTLEVGDSIVPGRLMSSAQNDPMEVAGYETTPNHYYTSNTSLLFTITLGVGVTQGSGLLIIEIQP